MSREAWTNRLQALRDNHLERQLLELKSMVGPEVETADGAKLLFCSNDYLGLPASPQLCETLHRSRDRWGAGSASSRLVSGHTSAHRQAETRMAELLGYPDAVLFSSGYHANVGSLGALTTAGDQIFSDALVHASIIDGCRLSKAAVHVYRHGDMAQLDTLLAANPSEGVRLIATDALFSMDGDYAPLTELIELAFRHNALIYLDEAHSFGIVGPGGRGLGATVADSSRIAARVITLGKSAGLAGALVVPDHEPAALLRSSARSLMYTTAQPAALAQTGAEAIEMVLRADEERRKLEANIQLLRRRLHGTPLDSALSESPIQPIIVGPADRALTLSKRLYERGMIVQAIRPPTVPEGSSRLRITLSAFHTSDHIDRLAANLKESWKEIIDT